MGEINKEPILKELTAVRETLERVAQSLAGVPELDGQRALGGLVSANETLVAVLRQIVEDSDSSFGGCRSDHSECTPKPELLKLLQQPLDYTDFVIRARRALEEIPVFVVRDNLPVELRHGVRTFGELAQLNLEDFTSRWNFGERSLQHIIIKLGKSGLALATPVSESECQRMGIAKIKSEHTFSDRYGEVKPYLHGEYAIGRGAKEIINLPVAEIPSLSSWEVNQLTTLRVRQLDGTKRGLATVGDLIQITHPQASLQIPLAAVNFLLKHGLCLKMQLSDTQLDQLGTVRVEQVD